MCRWLAYQGDSIYLEDLVIKPRYSLIDQSLDARHSETTTNADGFGIGWYGNRDFPGVYKDIRPAWNDPNLHALTEQIRSPLFLAHVRAATGTSIQRSNCHPFRYGCWLFVHNGNIREFQKLKRELTFAIAPELYPHVAGTTDSEIMFFLALTFGLTEDVRLGVARMVGFVEEVGQRHDIGFPIQMSLGISDGEKLFAFRYSSEHQSRSLFHSVSAEAVREVCPTAVPSSGVARAVVSEPLTELTDAWTCVPESCWLTVDKGKVRCEEFAPETP